MNKEIDAFLLQIAQSIFRYTIHEDLPRLFDDIDALYAAIQHIRDIKNIYIGPLHPQSTYLYSLTSSFLAIADAVINNKEAIYGSAAYIPDWISEGIRPLKSRDSLGLLLCLGFLFGQKIFAHEGIIYRLQHINKSELLQITDYSDPIFGIKTLHYTEHAIPMFRRIFELLNLVPSMKYSAYHRLYGIADIFIKVHEDVELPTKIPLDLAWYPSVQKAYLRYIMNNAEGNAKYLDAFNNILANTDRFTKQALYYFQHTVGGVYTPTKEEYPTQLSKWYNKKINEKQLDEVFDDVIKDERRVFEILVQLGIGISLEANLRLTKKRFSRIQKLVESRLISRYKELAGPFLIRDSSMLSIKILRRQIND